MSWRSASTSGVEAVLAQRRAGDRADRDDPRARREPRRAARGLQEEAHRRGGGEGDVVGLARLPRAPARDSGSATVSYSASTSTSAPRCAQRVGEHVARLAGARDQRARCTGTPRERLARATPRRSARGRRRRGSRARPAPRAVPGPIAATVAPASARASSAAARGQPLRTAPHAVGAGQADQVVGGRGRAAGRRPSGSMRITGACDDARAQRRQPRASPLACGARAGHRHGDVRPAGRRQPGELARRARHRADDRDRRRADVLAARTLARSSPSVAAHGALAGQRAALRPPRPAPRRGARRRSATAAICGRLRDAHVEARAFPGNAASALPVDRASRPCRGPRGR